MSDDASLLTPRLRVSDLREIQATSAADPCAAVARCIERSEFAWTGFFGEDIAFIGGVTHASFLGMRRSPWLLGTPALERNGRQFLRYCRDQMPDIRRAYPNLENYIDARSTRTIAWLRWLGFTVEEDTVPYGVLRRPFHRFTLKQGADVV